MNYDEFVEWSYKYCPTDVDMDDFHQYLACANANLINALADKLNVTVPDILEQITPDFKSH